MMADDFNEFIRIQKDKIAQERSALNPEVLTFGGIPFGRYEEKRKMLNNERRAEFKSLQTFLSSAKPTRYSTARSTPETTLPIGGFEEKRKLLNQQQHDYHRLLAKRSPRFEEYLLKHNVSDQQRTEPEQANNNQRMNGNQEGDGGFMSSIGSYERTRRKLQEQRKEEYNKLQSEKNVRSTGNVGQSSKPYVSTLPGYNENDLDSAKSIPGVRDHQSAELAKMKTRNREYNEFLEHNETERKSRNQQRPARGDNNYEEDRENIEYLRDYQPRKGWATPTYEEILDSKRKEERRYRQNDPDVYPNHKMRSSISDGNLNRSFDEDQRKFHNLDNEFDTKKVRFERNLQYPNSERRRRPVYSELDEELSRGRDFDYKTYDDDRRDRSVRREDSYANTRDRRDDRYTNGDDRPRRREPEPPAPRSAREPEPEYGTSLLVGNEVSASANIRKKEAYRRELEEQMQQDKDSRRRFKEEDSKMQSVATLDSSRTPRNNNQYPSRTPRQQEPPPPTTRRRPSPDDFSEPMGKFASPLDEAYHYFATRNILDPNPSYADMNAPPVKQVPSYEARRESPPPQTRQRAARPAEVSSVLPFPSGGDSDKTEKQRNYQQQLMQQIEDTKKMKQKDKEDRQRYEQKLDEEIRNYDPFGKGGGGAPMRDKFGNIVADLRKMHNDNVDPSSIPPTHGEPPPTFTPAPTTAPTPRSNNDPSFARGGHGIFGEPQSNEQKTAKQRYQDDLRLQIEEKKKESEKQKEMERMEEEKFLKKMEDDNRHLQDQLEAEREREKEKAKQRISALSEDIKNIKR